MSSSTSLEQAPPSPDYVPDPEYSEYVAPSDDKIPIENRPLPADASPIALSPGYVDDSDPLEEVPEDDHEEDLADYSADGGDEEEEESSEDDDDDEDEAFEKDEDEEEEHLALADSVVLPAIDLVPSALIVEYASVPIPPSPPPSPLSPLSSSLLRIASPPLLLPPLHTMPTYANAPLCCRKRLCLTALAFRFEVEESSTTTAVGLTRHTLACRVDYGYIDTLDARIRASKGRGWLPYRRSIRG
uniref:Uncharacterized protein n=1 Tax=Tanacetum cinerariifolium TaxID=118510 RepID=A0A6L2M533_TANCI|nr:hypothetical protein [Tanacetum cinerariifolium]